MDIWDEIKTLAGYQSGRGGVDSYGVDHSGFSTRDELEYQSARLARENQLAEGFAKQGIAEENYPQFGTNFWGGTPENNYGFGTSNIKQNIENVTNRLNNGGFSGGTNNGFNNNTNNGQVFANSNYTVNTESLIGKPSSYFQNNNSAGVANNSTGSWENNVTSALSSNTSGINNPVQSGNSSEIQNAGGYNSAEAQKQAQILQAQRNAVNQILMYGMDALYGMNRTVNGMTFGGLDYLGNKLGYDTQMNDYLQLKTPQEREAAQTAGQLVGYSRSALTGGALASAGLDRYVAKNGRKNLINQLTNGNNFRDIRYRNISNEFKDTLNDNWQNLNQPTMKNNRMYIPANVVKKLYEKRIISDGMTPEELADSIDRAIYSPNSVIFRTKYNQNQAVINSSGNKLDIGFVSVNPSKPNQNVIKSDYQIKLDDLYRTLFGNK